MSEQTVTTTPEDRHECRACGYVYEPDKGDSRREVAPGTPFETLPVDWTCPICNAPTKQFLNIGVANAPSGFEENLTYGFGVNTMTPGQKNLLIFGALAGLALFLLSFYGMS